MTGTARESIRPNVLAALPGRMVDEAPKKHGRDAGGRPQKLAPALLGFLGMAITGILLVWYGLLDVIVTADGLVMDLGILAMMLLMLVGTAVLPACYTYLNLRTRSYALFDDRVEMQEGFLGHEAKTVPYDQVTGVTLRKNVWERRFDAGTVVLQTAADDHGDLWIRGIHDPDATADRIRDLVNRTPYQGGRVDAA